MSPSGQPNATADGDDNAFSDDEDSMASFPPLPSGATTSYAVTLSARNISGSLGDALGLGGLQQRRPVLRLKQRPASVAQRRRSRKCDLDVVVGIRNCPRRRPKPMRAFRITTNSLTDNGATPQDERAQGRASDGEVEDYAITVIGDYGDAPASYGDPSHSPQGPYLGATQPDSESGSQHTATALGDDLDNTDDEDGVASLPPFSPATTSYTVLVTAHNTSGGPATLWGWVDFNGDGQFAAAEAASATVANGSNPASVPLNWPAVTVTPPASGISYARFRITTGALTDNGGDTQRRTCPRRCV